MLIVVGRRHYGTSVGMLALRLLRCGLQCTVRTREQNRQGGKDSGLGKESREEDFSLV